MKIYNTLTKRKEEFVPVEPGKVKMYVCGPTVYNFIHIGNARPMIVFDTVRRYFEYKGYDVNYVSNFTDVDDKIIKKAIEEGVDAETISKRYIAECKKDMEGMNIEPATKNPLATEEICGMLNMISTLIEKGYAYVAADGTVYYSVRKFKDYGKLSHKNLDDLQSGFREIKVTGEEGKQDPNDFVLWKPKKEGEPYWESPWCEGRPGWHIECSVMAKRYLGDEIDIHAGGEDLIFPHHENEIAQSEAANGKPFEWLEIFIHAPFKEDITVCKEDDDKNATSIVVQFGFKISSCAGFKCRVLMGGDAEHEIWQHILDNNIDDEHLKWDIFLAPHHCSWTFFNDSSDKEKVMPSAEEIMKKQLGSRAYVVASSNAIMNDGKNPPCYQAQTEYKKRLGNKDNFLNTATDHLKGNISQPIVFKIAETGKRHETISVAAGDTIISRPAPRAGK